MKKLILVALVLLTNFAFATGYDPVTISGSSVQMVIVDGSAVSNRVHGNNSTAQQNLASNVGGAEVSGSSMQIVVASGSIIRNEVIGSQSYASQNFSSNIGSTAEGGTLQLTALLGANAYNSAGGYKTFAIQNVASQNACFNEGSVTYSSYKR
jgi:hypothetical protein